MKTLADGAAARGCSPSCGRSVNSIAPGCSTSRRLARGQRRARDVTGALIAPRSRHSHGLRFAQWTNAGNVLPSTVGRGLRVSETPGAMPFGIVSAKPADTYFAFGWLRSKLIVTFVGEDTIDEMTPVACSARANELPFDKPSCPFGSGGPPNASTRQVAPIISWMIAPAGRAVASPAAATTATSNAAQNPILIRIHM